MSTTVNQWKPGDRIKCIGMDPHYGGQLEIGKVYHLEAIDGPTWGKGWLTVVESKAWCYENKYFVKADYFNREVVKISLP